MSGHKKRFCSLHKMENNEYKKQLREFRKLRGLCVNCGKPMDREGTRCKECREKINKWNKENREWYLSHRICPRCKKNDLMGDETICPECRAKEINTTLKNRKKDEYNAYQRKLSKSIYQKRKESGICTRCGKRKATQGFTTCAMCRERDNETRRIRKGTSERSDRESRGLCFFCNNPVKKGYKVCEYHYQINLNNLSKARETNESQEYIKSIKKIQYRSVNNGRNKVD